MNGAGVMDSLLDSLRVCSADAEVSIDAGRLSAGLQPVRANSFDHTLPISDSMKATDGFLPPRTPTQGAGQAGESVLAVGMNPGGYRLDRVIGRGGQGEIWEATQDSLGRRVAVKRMVIPRSSTGDTPTASAHLTQSFHSEAFITAVLDHPNIIPIYDVIEDGSGNPALAMKLVRGTTWEDLLRADRMLGMQQRLYRHLLILVDVAQAVAFAHSRGVIHRDLKPSQVMVGEFGEVFLMDWGLACVFRDDEDSSTDKLFAGTRPVPLSKASNPAGTPSYMAPEQTLPTTEKLGPWTDVFLLGAVLYYLLTDTAPNQGRSAIEAIRMAEKGERDPPEKRCKDERQVPPELSRICMKAMSFNAWERHTSVGEFLDELNGFLQGFGRRRESLELTDQAAERLSLPELSYRQLEEANMMIGKARLLYTENPVAAGLQCQLLKRFAEAAMGNGELFLARENADQLPESPEKSNLLEEITRREDAGIRKDRQRRIAVVASAMMTVLLMFALLWIINQSNRIAILEKAALTGQVAER